jgi:hypothetical protein
MHIPGLGSVTHDPRLGLYVSEPVGVPVLGGVPCRITVEAYDDDPDPEAIQAAIRNFLAAAPGVLRAAEPYIYQYYLDCRDYAPDVRIEAPGDVWAYIQLGTEPIVSRRAYGDRRVYISVECECAWEEEHGLEIVFEEGRRVNKIGQYDSHATNSDAYSDPSLENVIYRGG